MIVAASARAEPENWGGVYPEASTLHAGAVSLAPFNMTRALELAPRLLGRIIDR